MNRSSAWGSQPSAWMRLSPLGQGRRASRRARFQPLVERMEGRALLATLHVGPGDPYATIQAAVDDADSGDTIAVDPGTYTEQVTIPDTLDNLTLRSTTPLGAIIQAPATLTGENSVVVNDGASNFTFTGFTVSGPADGIRAGVLVQDGGSARIFRNHVTNIQFDPFSGIQTGIGILVDGASATIERNTVDDYQKAGIVVDGTNGAAFATVERNTVTGVGPTGLTAQNGIQISNGALARVTRNDVSDNLYTGTDAAAGGIILIDAGPTRVDNNDVTSNDVGIGVQDTSLAIIDSNKISDSTDDGIQLLGTTSLVLVTNNDSSNNGLDGIFVDSTVTGNLIVGNKFRKNGHLDAEDLSSGFGTARTGNLWINNKGKTDNKNGRLVR